MQKMKVRQVDILGKYSATILTAGVLIYCFFEDYFSNTFSYLLLGTTLLLSLSLVVMRSKGEPISSDTKLPSMLIIVYVIVFLFPQVIGIPDSDSANSAVLMITVLMIGVTQLHVHSNQALIAKWILILSSVHAVSTVVSFAFPAFFTQSILPLVPDHISERIEFFLSRQLYSGITAQTGRNSVYLACGISVLVGSLIANRKRSSMKRWILMLLFGGALLLTAKRGTFLAIIVAILIATIIIPKVKTYKKLYRILIAIVGLFLIAYIFSIFVPDTAAILLRFIPSDGVDITSGRSSLFAESFALFLEKPLFGWGFGYFSRVNDISAHNMYLQLLSDTGFIGFALFIALFSINLKKALSKIKTQDCYNEDERAILNISFIFQIFFLVYGLTDSGIMNAFTLLFYLIMSAFPYQLKNIQVLSTGVNNSIPKTFVYEIGYS